MTKMVGPEMVAFLILAGIIVLCLAVWVILIWTTYEIYF